MLYYMHQYSTFFMLFSHVNFNCALLHVGHSEYSYWKLPPTIEQRPETSHPNHWTPNISLEKESYQCQVLFLIIINFFAAAQMWNFVTLLPLIVGDYVPLDETNWECFLLLLQIVKINGAQLKQHLLHHRVSLEHWLNSITIYSKDATQMWR